MIFAATGSMRLAQITSATPLQTNGLSGRRIDRLGRRLREVAGALERGRHDGVVQERAGGLTQPRVGGEEEGPVFQRAARRRRRRTVCGRAAAYRADDPQSLALNSSGAQEIEDRAVILVRPRLGDDVDDAAGETAVFHAVAVGLDLELLNGVRVGQDVAGVAQPGHVDAAVEVVVHRAGAAVGAAVDQRALLGVAEHERAGAGRRRRRRRCCWTARLASDRAASRRCGRPAAVRRSPRLRSSARSSAVLVLTSGAAAVTVTISASAPISSDDVHAHGVGDAQDDAAAMHAS